MAANPFVVSDDGRVAMAQRGRPTVPVGSEVLVITGMTRGRTVTLSVVLVPPAIVFVPTLTTRSLDRPSGGVPATW